MKKLAFGLMAAVALGAMAFATGAQAADKVIGYYMDASDDFYKAGYEVFKTLAEREGWTVLDVVGQGTAPEQIAAVENFITQGVDALLVVQNSPETTSRTLKLAKDAGIPEFHLTHNPPNEPGLAGFAGYDWVTIGDLCRQIRHEARRQEAGHDRRQARSGHRLGPDRRLPASPMSKPARTSATSPRTSASRAPAARTCRSCSGVRAAGSPIRPRR